MNWKQMDEMEQKASCPTPPRSRWLRYRKWLMIPGVFLAIFLILQIQTGLEILRHGHVCRLPKPGESLVLPVPRTERTVRWYALHEDEEIPWTSTQIESEKWEMEARRTENWGKTYDYVLYKEWMAESITAMCEVECIHIVNLVGIYDEQIAPEAKNLYTLAEYRVKRVLAQRNDAKKTIQEGEVISTFTTGNSKLSLFGMEPAYAEGDCFLLSVQPVNDMASNNIDTLFVHDSDYHVRYQTRIYLNEVTGQYELGKKVRFDYGEGESYQLEDENRPQLDQIGEFFQKTMDESEYRRTFR